MNEVVITQDISSGRIHKRYRMPGGQLASFEGCNLDDAGDFRVLQGTADEPEEAFCHNCFPVSETVVTVGNDSVTLP